MSRHTDAQRFFRVFLCELCVCLHLIYSRFFFFLSYFPTFDNQFSYENLDKQTKNWKPFEFVFFSVSVFAFIGIQSYMFSFSNSEITAWLQKPKIQKKKKLRVNLLCSFLIVFRFRILIIVCANKFWFCF